jgi:hypothetical protein
VLGCPQPPVDILGNGEVLWRVGAVIAVETDAEGGEVTQMFLLHAFHQGFRRDPLALGAQHDGGAVGIVGADVDAVVAPQFVVTDPDVRLGVLDEMAKVQRTIGIGKGVRERESENG